MFGLGMQELIIIFLIVFLLFGAKNIPEIAKGLGKGLKEFKNAFKSISDDAAETKEDKSKDSQPKNV